MSSSTAHLAALGRAELTLLFRNRTNLFTVVFMPGMLTLAFQPTLKTFGQSAAADAMGPSLMAMSFGIVLVMALYSALPGVYAARREELFLKRMRTGEVSDLVILAGSALPMVLMALAQCVALAVGISVVADVPAPEAPHLAVLGVLLGVVMMAALAALTSTLARTAESAQVVVLPGMIVLLAGSGLFLPLDALPGALEEICRFLPLTPVADLIRAGWSGEATGAGIARQALTALTWTGAGVLALRRYFRWEPRV
ncbi:ABC transporter permease [Streptomyces sp. NPDC002055]|uniref:ABC transporter permease n=1 Tax=Streptomyces sp. NPDC002055 TaxID=3154534 RepID=UPI003323D2D4